MPTQPVAPPATIAGSGGPEYDDLSGCVLEGFCTLPPVSNKCDPWEELDWCQGDGGGGDCMNSQPGTDATQHQAITGCTSPGSGGPTPPPLPPSSGDPLCPTADTGECTQPPPPAVPSLSHDMARDTLPPDCSSITLTQWQHLYCFRASAPDSAQRRATLQALDAIAARGSQCAAIAETGRDLLAGGQIRFFAWQEGDAGAYGHRNTGIQINDGTVRLYGTPGSDYEGTLVHEIDHVLGFVDHIDDAGQLTPNMAQCG